MMTKQLIFIALGTLFFKSFANAAVYFHCYSFPSTPVQVYEYGIGNTGGFDSAKNESNIGKNVDTQKTKKDVLCVYRAGCVVVSEAIAKSEPAPKTSERFFSEIDSGELKGSILLCKGVGLLGPMGNVIESECPKPTACQREVFYNYNRGPVSSPEPGAAAAQTLKDKEGQN